MSNLESNERVISNGPMLPFIGAIVIHVNVKCYTVCFLKAKADEQIGAIQGEPNEKSEGNVM